MRQVIHGGTSSQAKRAPSRWARTAGFAARLAKPANSRPVRLAVIFLLGSGWFTFLARSPELLRDLPSLAEADLPLLLASAALTLIVVFLGSLTWCLTLRGLGQEGTFLSMARVHLRANLAKYIPGYLWHWVGKACGSHALGVSAPTIAGAMGLELAIIMISGLGVTCSLIPDSGTLTRMGFEGIAAILRGTGPFILAVLACLPHGAAFWMRRYRSTQPLNHWAWMSRPVMLVNAVLVAISGWLLLGLALWLIAAAYSPLSLSSLRLFVFAMAASLLAGLAAIIVPVGIGVREGVMVYILGAQLPLSLALTVAAVSRLLIITCEIAATAILEWVGPGSAPAGKAPGVNSKS